MPCSIIYEGGILRTFFPNVNVCCSIHIDFCYIEKDLSENTNITLDIVCLTESHTLIAFVSHFPTSPFSLYPIYLFS